MHVSLAYFCCLRNEEAYHVREIMRRFIQERSFYVPAVSFDRIECWKEAFNSITNIVVVDNASQQRLLAILNELIQEIEAEGIPITVSRLTQMLFHATLLAFRLGNVYSLEEKDNIDPMLQDTFETLQTINSQWTKVQQCFDIQHDPKFSPSIKQHTHLKGVQ